MTSGRTIWRRAGTVAVIAALGAAPVAVRGQQPAAPPDPFAAVAFLLGLWEGTSEGQPGTAMVRRDYSRALDSRFIRVRNRSEYAPQAKNPKGEIHEDEGFISYDRVRQRLVLRQFHVEGFVNQYVQEPGAALVFTSESIENLPAAWRARESYIVHGPDEFEEIFELAEPGKAFAVYSRVRLKRVAARVPAPPAITPEARPSGP
jgi:hypothetical protein